LGVKTAGLRFRFRRVLRQRLSVSASAWDSGLFNKLWQNAVRRAKWGSAWQASPAPSTQPISESDTYWNARHPVWQWLKMRITQNAYHPDMNDSECASFGMRISRIWMTRNAHQSHFYFLRAFTCAKTWIKWTGDDARTTGWWFWTRLLGTEFTTKEKKTEKYNDQNSNNDKEDNNNPRQLR